MKHKANFTGPCPCCGNFLESNIFQLSGPYGLLNELRVRLQKEHATTHRLWKCGPRTSEVQGQGHQKDPSALSPSRSSLLAC